MSDDTARLAAWFAARLPDARDVRLLDGPRRLNAGHSNDTFAVDVGWRDAAGEAHEDAFVLRAPPAGAGLLEPYDVAKQHRVMDALAGSAVPVPRMYWLEETGDVLGRPFFAMERLRGIQFELDTPADIAADPALCRRMFERMVRTMAAIHTFRWEDTDLAQTLGDGAGHLDAELDRWEADMRRVQLTPLPACEHVLDWLRRNRPPDPARPSLVHGDVKLGNFMWDGEEPAGILDWELASIGDPMTDVAYFLMVAHDLSGPSPVTGSMTRAEVLALYEEASGITPYELAWHEVLQGFKLAVIFLISYHMFETGNNDLRFAGMGSGVAPMLAFILPKTDADPGLAPDEPPLSPARVAEACTAIIEQSIVPALADPELRTQAFWMSRLLPRLIPTAATVS